MTKPSPAREELDMPKLAFTLVSPRTKMNAMSLHSPRSETVLPITPVAGGVRVPALGRSGIVQVVVELVAFVSECARWMRG